MAYTITSKTGATMAVNTDMTATVKRVDGSSLKIVFKGWARSDPTDRRNKFAAAYLASDPAAKTIEVALTTPQFDDLMSYTETQKEVTEERIKTLGEDIYQQRRNHNIETETPTYSVLSTAAAQNEARKILTADFDRIAARRARLESVYPA